MRDGSPIRNTRRMAEKPKRLKTRPEALRELHLRSGNQCAFDPCVRVLINDHGQWVGEVCHIEGALPTSSRFNDSMTNEERRAFGNLVLMCHDHHVETDDETRFPVETMRRIKADHEAKFSGEEERRQAAAVFDLTVGTPRFYGTSLEAMITALWPDMTFTEDEVDSMVEAINGLADRLAHLPQATRGMLAVLVSRGRPSRNGDVALPARELGETCGIADFELRDRMATLEDLELSVYGEDDSGIVTAETWVDRLPWPIWLDLRTFCEAEGYSVETIVRDLRFDLLD